MDNTSQSSNFPLFWESSCNSFSSRSFYLSLLRYSKKFIIVVAQHIAKIFSKVLRNRNLPLHTNTFIQSFHYTIKALLSAQYRNRNKECNVKILGVTS